MNTEEKEVLQQTLNKRNTETVQIVLEKLNQKIYDQDVKITNLFQTVNTLVARINSLEQIVQIQKVMMTGRGPTAVSDR